MLKLTENIPPFCTEMYQNGQLRTCNNNNKIKNIKIKILIINIFNWAHYPCPKNQ